MYSQKNKIVHSHKEQFFNNFFLTRDIKKFLIEKNIPFYILQTDQEKAFDKVDREFLYKTMEK